VLLVVPGRPPNGPRLLVVIRRRAKSVTGEKRPSNADEEVRRIANSDHRRCVSKPRCRRASWNVASTCHIA
jgi:hypothetical protein